MNRSMRGIRNLAGVFVLCVGISLFILTERTDTYFAWTIGAPVTAAFLGGSYLPSLLLEFRSAREPTWDRVRVGVPGVLVMTALILVATLLHLDAFHFDAPRLITRAGTWVWLFVYLGFPPALAIIWYLQARRPGTDPPRRAPLSAPARWLLGVQAAVFLGFGVALFVAPEGTAGWWPWALTPLTGRTIGAWLVGIGVAVAQSAGENDWTRLEPIMFTYWVFAVLQFVVLARYPGAVAWEAAPAWGYLGFLLTVLGVGLYGWLAARRSRQAA